MFVQFLRFFADMFFARRYGHRAVVLETIAAVPGMVGGTLQHLRSLRRMEGDHGRIRILLEEAENERMNLMTFMQIVRPTRPECLLVLLAQGVFYNLYFLFYAAFPAAARSGRICPWTSSPAKRGKGNKPKLAPEGQDQTPAERRDSMTWVRRLKRVFGIDIEACQRCGGAVRVIACIEDPAVIGKMLAHLEEKAAAVESVRLPESRAPGSAETW